MVSCPNHFNANLDHRLYEYWLFSSTPSSLIERFANGYPQPEDILAEPEEKLPFGALGEVLGPKVKIEDRNPEAHVLLDKYMDVKMTTSVFSNLMEGLR